MKRLSVLILLFTLAACSTSKAPMKQFYMLNSHTPLISASPKEVKRVVVVDRILLADYLKRPNLVMQIEGNQLYYSDIDLWAENLQTGIHNTLLAWLNDKATETRFIAYNSPDATGNLERLVISIERFMPTDQGQVITSGQYWHVNKAQTDGLTSQESFAFTSELSQQGYSHSVTLLAEQLLKLSHQIINDIE